MILDEEVYLEHFGVKGMKWGVRKGKSETGVSRRRAAFIDRDQREIESRTKAINRSGGKVHNALTALDRKFMGEEMFTQFHATQISTLRQRQDRVAAGELLIRDRIAMNMLTTPLSTILERKR